MSDARTDRSANLARAALQLAALGVLVVMNLWILRPFLLAGAWATMIAIATWPLLLYAQAWLGGRRSLAVAALTLALLLVLVVPLYVGVSAIVENVGEISSLSSSLAAWTVPEPPSWLESVPLVGAKAAAEWSALAAASPESLAERVTPYASELARWFVSEVGNIGALLLNFLLTLVLTAILYVNGEAAAAAAERFARRLAGAQGEKAAVLAGQAIRAVALGVVVTAVVQTSLVGIGLAVVGVPFAPVLTVLAFILAIAQIGPLPVLIGAVIWVFAREGGVWGTGFLIWATLCSTIDNFVRPVLIRRGADLPLLLIFGGVIGGLVAFGVLGLFIGPVMLAVGYMLLLDWMHEPEEREVQTLTVQTLQQPSAYTGETLRADVVAGLTAAAVVIPKAMAYATIAGLPVQVGLYTAFVPMLVYAAFGTSRPLSVSTTTTIAILVASDLSGSLGGGGAEQLAIASATLAVLVGAMLVLASVLRLGFVANFISDPVLAGFKSGIGLVIIADQIPKVFGFHIHKAGFFRDLVAVVQHLPETSLPTLAVAAAILVLIVLLERFVPRAPAPLIAVAAGIAISGLLGLSHAGVETVGEVPRALPGLILPNLALVRRMWPGAAGIALMSFTESIAAGRAFAKPDEPRPQPNRELLALGLANVAGGFLGAMVAGGGTSQTAVNRSAGARTQISGVTAALAAVATALLFAPLLGLLPNAVLAVVVVVYSLGLIEPKDFHEIGRVRRTEYYWALIALAGVALLGTLKGIMVAVIASVLALAQQAYDPPVYPLGRKRGTDVFRPPTPEHPDDETWAGLLLVRPEGRLFFANAQRVSDKIWSLIQEAKASVIVIDLSAVFDIEYTALKMFSQADETLRRNGLTLWLAALNPEVFKLVERSRLGETLGRERMFFTVQRAVEEFERSRGSGPRIVAADIQ